MAESNIRFPSGENIGSPGLNELLCRIVQLDKEGREITAHAEDARKNAELSLAQQVERMRAEYNERTENRLKVIEQEEQGAAEALLEKEQQSAAESESRLEQIFAQNGEKWAQEIYERVIRE